MEFTVELSAQAESDIEEAYEYIKRRAPQTAIKWRRNLEKKLRNLSALPGRFGLAPEHFYASVEIRQQIFGTYRILFTIRKQLAYVLTVRRGARRFLSQSDIDRLT
jgi:plasmid stabilization system protein ParE